jgi:glycyl-tRNA synthetase
LYMEKIGMDVNRLRFRQHLTTEMAHYAADCWDLEIQSSYGWVECVGHADRACYDLQVHSTATKTPMVATEKVDPPQEIEYAKLKLDRKELGKVFMNEQRVVAAALEALAEEWMTFEPVATALETDGKTMVDGYEVTKAMVSWTKTKKTIHERKFTPSVIEPSFGMGRILYSLLEHSFYQRDGDEQRCVMRFKPQVAPEKCAVFPISSNKECNVVVDMIAADLLDNDLATRVDKSTASLGRRYARADELGVPFAVTVDFQSVQDNTVTLRERDSTKQIRLHKDEITNVISKIVRGKMTWTDLTKKYPMVQVDDGEDNNKDSTPATNGNVETSSTVIETTIRGSFRRPVPDEE